MEIKNKYIFMFGAGKFDAPYPSASFTLAKEFAKNNNTVYYIDYPFTWKDRIMLKKTQQYKIREKAFSGNNDGIIDIQIPNLKVVIIPPVLSIHFLPEGKLYRLLLKSNEKIIINRLKRILKKDAAKDLIYINSFNFHYPNLAKSLKPVFKVYHCVDPIITPYDIKHGRVSENLLVENSDLIICTSKQLYDEKKIAHPNTYFIPNAADINHSIKATDKSLPIHSSLENIKKPVIGYFGNIERRIDYDLVLEVAAKNPDKSFVFVGPMINHLVPDSFFNAPNIHLTGRIPYEQMPSVLKGFDVALIPFKKNADSATVFPLKLFEYLGAGKPVVSTDFNPDLKNFTNDLVDYASTAEAFSTAINEALKNDCPSQQEARIELASDHTWKKRASDIESLIDKNLYNTEVKSDALPLSI
jgi:teichuronic acid biosynthesis glycosyltransferase TuaH